MPERVGREADRASASHQRLRRRAGRARPGDARSPATRRTGRPRPTNRRRAPNGRPRRGAECGRISAGSSSASHRYTTAWLITNDAEGCASSSSTAARAVSSASIRASPRTPHPREIEMRVADEGREHLDPARVWGDRSLMPRHPSIMGRHANSSRHTRLGARDDLVLRTHPHDRDVDSDRNRNRGRGEPRAHLPERGRHASSSPVTVAALLTPCTSPASSPRTSNGTDRLADELRARLTDASGSTELADSLQQGLRVVVLGTNPVLTSAVDNDLPFTTSRLRARALRARAPGRHALRDQHQRQLTESDQRGPRRARARDAGRHPHRARTEPARPTRRRCDPCTRRHDR